MFFRCRAALSGRKLKLREQTRIAYSAEAALEINIESSFVEIAEDVDSINRDAKIQTRAPATIGSQIIEVPTVI